MRARAAALALIAASLACGESPPEQRLESASEQLTEAREEAAAVRERLDRARAREVESSDALREARRALRAAEQDVLSAEQRVARRATDVALFRTLQATMLEAPELRRSAVEVRVDDAVVTLAGTVSDHEAHQRALALARSTAGVRGVRDELDVVDDAEPRPS